ncbi:MAG: type II secretion system protein [bacterium]
MLPKVHYLFVIPKKEKGSSLIEILAVFSIVSIMMAAALASFNKTQKTIALQNAQASLIQSLEQARSRAIDGIGTENHGILIQDEKIVSFEGDSFEGIGEEIKLPSSVFSDKAGTTIVFDRLSGSATSTEQFPLTITLENEKAEKQEITITEEGVIE